MQSSSKTQCFYFFILIIFADNTDDSDEWSGGDSWQPDALDTLASMDYLADSEVEAEADEGAAAHGHHGS